MTLIPGQRAPARLRPPAGRLRRARHRGQALVELAIILPIMLFLLLGALDLGRVFYANITVASAAKEAALRASQGETDAAAAAVNESRGGFVAIAAGDVTTAPDPTPCNDTTTFGTTVTATVTTQFKAITPYVGALLGGQTITLTSVATANCVVLPTIAVATPTATPAGTPTPTPTPGATPTPTPTPTPIPTPTPTPTPACVTVPNVVGQNVSAAAATLSGLGFNVSEFADLTTSTKGKVQSQSPNAGPCAPYGSTVTIHYRPPRS